jgi:D-arabinose 1-dehydrogenase-like Zn-dependent alcohol dehydrogenase
VGLAGGTARVTALKPVKPEVWVSVSWWGNIRELGEVLALADSGRLTRIPLEFCPLDEIKEVYDRMKHRAPVPSIICDIYDAPKGSAVPRTRLGIAGQAFASDEGES